MMNFSFINSYMELKVVMQQNSLFYEDFIIFLETEICCARSHFLTLVAALS